MASTLVSTLYPPLVDTFMPAFINTEAARVAFSLSPYNTIDKIKYLHVTVVDQTNNQNVLQPSNLVNSTTDKGVDAMSALLGSVCLDGVLIIPFSKWLKDENSEAYAVEILTDYLKNIENNEDKVFKADQYYKVQLRLDSTPDVKIKGKTLSSDYLLDNRQYFSEWSSVCLIRPIEPVSLYLNGFERAVLDPSYPVSFSQGYVHLAGELRAAKEHMQSYRFRLVEGEETVVDSGLVYPTSNPNEINYLLSADSTAPGHRYKLLVDVVTKNQYHLQEEYWVQIAQYDTNYKFEPDFNFEENVEDGYIKVNIVPKEKIQNSEYPPGKLYVKRASSRDNFKTWELISCTEEQGSGNFNISFIDSTVASMVQYKYSAQFWFAGTNTWSMVKVAKDKDDQDIVIYPTFYDIMLSRKDIQLALRYNGQLTSMKQNIQRTKFDTLGSKYPKFAENAKMNYKQYSLSGLICAEGDFNRTFMSELEEPYQSNMMAYDKVFGESYMLRNDTIADGVQEFGTSEYQPAGRAAAMKNSLHDVYPHENWYWERTFRDAVLEWLNDGEPKLFRSMPEGNMIVMVMDVNITPNQNIGRLLYNFTATLYEIGDGYSLTALDAANVIDVPSPKDAYAFDIDSMGSDYDDYFGVMGGTITTLEQIILKEKQNNEDAELRNVFYKNTNSLNEGVRSFCFVDENSISFSNIQVQFTSKPEWWVETGEGLQKASEGEASNLFGYVLVQDGQDIFVNERGYYYFNQNTSVSTLFIKSGTALVNFIATYDEIIKGASGSDNSYVSETIIGQQQGLFPYDEWMYDIIKQKYEMIYSPNKDEGKSFVKVEQGLDILQKITFEVTPYALVKILFGEEDSPESVEFMIGRSGVYNLSPDYPIIDFKFVGRRMVLNQNATYHELDPWEFRVAENDEDREHRNTIYQDVIWYNGEEYPFDYVDSEKKVIVAHVPIEGYATYLGDIIRREYVE